MIVYLIAAAQALFYLASVPLHLAVCLRTRGGLRIGVGVSAFERRFALNAALRRLARGPGRKPKPGKKPPVGRLAKAIRRLKPQITLRGRLNLGDAAATAMACGALRSLEAALWGVLPAQRDAIPAQRGAVPVQWGAAPAQRGAAPALRLRVAPEFQGEPGVELQGMIRARAGKIIYAALRGGIDEANGRIAQWKSTRLKT